MITPSKYQTAINDHVANKHAGNAVVSAVAGSGKTSSLEMAARVVVGQRGSLRVVAFNTSIVETLKQRMPREAKVQTFSGLGLGALMRVSQPEVAADKVPRIIQWLKEKKEVTPWLPAGKIKRVVGLAKSEGLVPARFVGDHPGQMRTLVTDTLESWETLFDHYAIDTDSRITPEILVGAARKVLEASIEWSERIVDFDDMTYMSALVLGRGFPRTDHLFVDELQDASAMQREVIAHALGRGTRFLGVGDPQQSLYSFRGADSDSMGRVAALTSAVQLPLPVCYRCPTSVLDLAREIVPQIEARPGAPRGLVEHLGADFNLASFLPGDLVLCRNRAPALTLAHRLLRAGKPVVLAGGKEAAEQTKLRLLDAAGDSRDMLISDVITRLEKSKARFCAAAQARDDEEALLRIEDDYSALRSICVACQQTKNRRTVYDLLASVDALYAGKREASIAVGTIHAAKGLEADRVWFLDAHLIPAKSAKRPWELAQESNLMYVGITRARKELRFIDSEKKEGASSRSV